MEFPIICTEGYKYRLAGPRTSLPEEELTHQQEEGEEDQEEGAEAAEIVPAEAGPVAVVAPDTVAVP